MSHMTLAGFPYIVDVPTFGHTTDRTLAGFPYAVDTPPSNPCSGRRSLRKLLRISVPKPTVTELLHKKTATLAQPPIPSPVAAVLLREYDSRDFSGSVAQLTGWLNARWAKTGYKVSIEEVSRVLSMNGRAFAAKEGECWDETFLR
ncbi:hypothetical protein K490DRAFT_61961 [Saccharata proteae CBS 121410]|uniref:Uncharacterized protein n=1 Tax=Saccharata proteae CBS 121410 TaxID=1314787 RepID=A0A9P4HWR5_9PEZI|nr:hypothetical protein K490DRAFT_61961 [Saccharata proteae CBS 121410]